MPNLAPALRERVTFARRVTITDAYGATRGDWVDQFTVAARIQPRLGGETVIAARLQGAQPVSITVRQSAYTREIDEGWRAMNARSGVVYAVHSLIDPDEHTADHGKFFEMLCETGVAA